MIMFPPCKINLGLSIRNKRSDGYHELETIMYQLPYCDILEITREQDFSFYSTGLQIQGDFSDNLCVKAFEIMRHKYGIEPVRIHLHKQIPMGAGLGGGSADGTYTLLALNQLYDLSLNQQTLRELALELGSDCPLFVNKHAQLAKGRGELLEPVNLDLTGYYIQLINLGIHVSTAEAFTGVGFSNGLGDLERIIGRSPSAWKERLHNDFEDSVFKTHPELAELKEKLYQNGALYASMTGSGSTLYGIFSSSPTSMRATYKKNMLEIITKM